MENKRPDDIKFLLNTFSITLIIVAILVTFQPYLEYETRIGEIKDVEAHLTTVDSQELPHLLTSKSGKPVMLVGYASWCGFCRLVLPVVMGMIKGHELDDVTPVFISFDTEPRKLSQYLVHNNYNTVVFPYVYGHSLAGNISSAMQPTGSSFTGVIPYIGFFDKNGKLKAESTGVVNERRLLQMDQKSKE